MGDGYDERYDDVWHAAWRRARDRLLAPDVLAQTPCTRPWPWWQYDAPADTPEDFFTTADELRTAAFLAERDLLVDEERDALLERVRELAGMGYANHDPHGNMARARALATAAGI